MDQHNTAVQAISKRLRSLYRDKEAYRVYHGSTNSTRNYKVDPRKMINTSALNRVITVDSVAKTALVEPNVSMDALVDATLKFGLVPPVVMEFPGITVGGGYSGTSGESSSFKHGFFDESVIWMEFVLPDGEVVEASNQERADLFKDAAGAFGTLGVATLFKLRLIEAKTYVEVTYWPWTSSASCLAAVESAAEDSSHDFVDGIIFSKQQGVAITGKMTNSISVNCPVRTFLDRGDPWFYLHVQKLMNKIEGPLCEAVPLKDYLFRYDRGTFWTARYAFKYFNIPFNRITRWLLDNQTKTRRMYHAFHASGLAQQYIVQDLALPACRAQQFIEYVDEEFDIFPLWLCPLQGKTHKSMHPQVRSSIPAVEVDKDEFPFGEENLINIGLWGPGPSNYRTFVKANRALESKVYDLGGMKWLYAQAFYTEEEFWRNFDRAWYDGLRHKYHADHLPSIYDKVKVNIRRAGPSSGSGDRAPVSFKRRLMSASHLNGLYGAAHMMLKKDYLLSNERTR